MKILILNAGSSSQKSRLYEWFEQGVRRYGFHGISHQYCAHRAVQLLGKTWRRCDSSPATSAMAAL